MSLDPEVPVTPEIVRGDDFVLNVQLQDKETGKWFNLSAASEIDCVLANADGTCLHKLKSTSGVVVTDGPSGAFQIIGTGSESALLLVTPDDGPLNSIECRITIAGKLKTAQLVEVFRVKQKLFPNC